jgi:hypothetical protein
VEIARSNFLSEFLAFSSVNHHSAITAYLCTTALPQKCVIVVASSRSGCLKLWAPCLTCVWLFTRQGSSNIPLLLFQEERAYWNCKESKDINTFNSFIHSPMALQSFVGPWPLLRYVIFFIQTVGLLGRVISSSHMPLLKHGTTKTQNKHIKKYPCLEWDSNPRSQCSSGKTQFISAIVIDILNLRNTNFF